MNNNPKYPPSEAIHSPREGYSVEEIAAVLADLSGDLDDDNANVDALVRSGKRPSHVVDYAASLALAKRIVAGEVRVGSASIPTGVYYLADWFNFYDAATGAGKGDAFFQQWRDRAAEFPQSRAAAPSAMEGR